MPDSRRSLMVTGIFTLTPTHCGTGQAAGAVDLPIAREKHTDLPLLPATTLKGIARDDWFGLPAERASWSDDHQETYERIVKPLFGPLPQPRRRPGEAGRPGAPAGAASEGTAAEPEVAAGDLVFLDGLLLCFPVRSLTGGFRMVTSPLLLQRLRRIAESYGSAIAAVFACPEPDEEIALLPEDQAGPLSLEDLVFPQDRCRSDEAVATLGRALGRLLALEESDADRQALPSRLVVVADAVLQDLTRRATPVTARIALRDNKTSENLWYEETLPPDCLFVALIAPRPGTRNDPLALLDVNLEEDERNVQIGGNATVGQGQCRWVLRPKPEVLI